MDLLAKSDEDIISFATQTLSQLIDAGNQKNWERFSSFFVVEGQAPEKKEDVENQWETNPMLTTFNPDFDFLGILRKTDHLVTLWKLRSDTTLNDILCLLAFQEVGNEIKVYGYRVI